MLVASITRAQTYSLDELLSISEQKNIEQQQMKLNQELNLSDLDVLNASQKWRLTANANLPNYFKTSRSVIQPNGSLAFQNVSQNTASAGFILSKPFEKTNSSVFVQTNLLRFDDFTSKFNSYNGVPVRAGIRQPINQFNAVKWNRKVIHKQKSVLNKQARQVQTKNALEITQNYFALLRAQINNQIASSNTKNSEKIYKIAKERHHLGKVSKSDLLQIELSLKNSTQAKIIAKRDLIRQSYLLKRRANIFNEQEVLNVLEPTTFPMLNEDAEMIADRAWKNQSNKENFELELLQTQQAIDKIKKDNGFQAMLEASVGFIKSGQNLVDVYQSPKNETLFNVGVSIPIFDGQFKKKSIQRAELRAKQTTMNQRFTETSFKENIKQLVHQLNFLQQEMKMSKESFELSKERYLIANKRYELGNISITDLTLAYNERDNSWRNYIQTIENYFTTYYLIKSF